MNYQAGDMLKYRHDNAICIVVSQTKYYGDFEVLWIAGDYDILFNVLSCKYWSMGSLNREFVRLS